MSNNSDRCPWHVRTVADRRFIWVAVALVVSGASVPRPADTTEEPGVLGLGPVGTRGGPLAATADTVRVMTYNIHHGAGMDEVIDLERIAALIRDVAPDLVALQEIDSVVTRTGGVDQAQQLARLTHMESVFGQFMPYQGGAYGMAVLSLWPVQASRNVRLPDGEEPRSSVVVEVTSPTTGGLLRFASIHFYRTEEERLAQATELQRQLPDDGVPTVLAGDYNSRPRTAVMEFFAQGWSVVDKGPDSYTFPSYAPAREIDFFVMRPEADFEILSQDVLDEAVASDHRPLVIDLIIRR